MNATWIIQYLRYAMKPTGLMVLFLAGLLLATGCEEAVDLPTRTEAMRRTLDPQVRAMLLEGDAAFQRGQYQQALAIADSVDLYEPELPDLHFFRGNVYLAMKQLDLAKSAFEKTVALDAQFQDAWLRIGDLELEQGRPGEAIKYYQKALAIEPTSVLYEKLGTVYAASGMADSAGIAYTKAIALDSTNTTAHLLYGQLLEKLGDYETALIHSHKALALRPGTPNYQFAVGAQLFRSGQLEEARSYLKKAADALPLHYPAQYNLGQVLLRLGASEEAQRYLARADSARILLKEITVLENAVARNPNHVEPWIRLGQLFQRAEMFERSAEMYNTALRITPGNSDAQIGLAKLSIAAGNTSDAIQRLKLVLFEDPARVEAQLDLGLAYAIMGQCDEAREAWEIVLNLSGSTNETHRSTARGYLAGLCSFNSQ